MFSSIILLNIKFSNCVLVYNKLKLLNNISKFEASILELLRKKFFNSLDTFKVFPISNKAFADKVWLLFKYFIHKSILGKKQKGGVPAFEITIRASEVSFSRCFTSKELLEGNKFKAMFFPISVLQ